VTTSSHNEEARDAHGRLQAILKATVVGAEVTASQSGAIEIDFAAFSGTGVLEPPYDPLALCLLFEHSNSLRQNVDSYATNIDGFGHRFEPAIDFDAEDVDQRVAEIVYLERLAQREQGKILGDVPLEPTAAETEARKQALRRQARAEKAKLDGFFEFCCFDHSFVDLRRRTRQDLEVTGNAFWEVLRNNRGEIARLVYVPAYSVRLLPLDREATEVTERARLSPVTLDTMTTRRRLRRAVQVIGSERVYFRMLGDPRITSKTSGRTYPDVAALLREEPGSGPATELLHFAIHSPRSPYGVPRWIGAMLAVLGSRAMEEVNYLYFNNKSVPPLALIVSNGRLNDTAVPRIERFVEENLKGVQNFHKLLIIEAEATGGPGDPHAKIELVPLTGAQQQDALFASYDERNGDKVGAAFRLPKLLRGESKDFNRSTAESALRLAEDQVFQPERDEFDFLVNRKLLAEMGIRFWRFKTQTIATRDPERMTDMVEKLVRVGVLTPEEGRMLAGDIFNREFRKIHDDWTKRPITLTLAGIQNQALAGGPPRAAEDGAPSGGLLDDAKKLLRLHEDLAAEEARLADARAALARRYHEGRDVERLKVPAAEFASWFEPRERS
jgi:PBSX family phage portal protein